MKRVEGPEGDLLWTWWHPKLFRTDRRVSRGLAARPGSSSCRWKAGKNEETVKKP